MRKSVESVLRKLCVFNGEAGTKWDDPSNLVRLNEVRELIYDEGDFEGTMDYGCLPIENCKCIYLPPEFEAIRCAWVDGSPITVRGSNYMTLPEIGIQSCCTCSIDARRSVQFTGVRIPFSAPQYTPYSLRVIFECEDDYPVTFRGVDMDGNIVSVTAESGPDPVDIGENFQRIYEVIKQPSMGRVTVFALRGFLDEPTTTFLARYQRHHENPTFSEMKIVNYMTGDCDKNLVFLAKKKYYDLQDFNQLVDIESIQALRFGYQAMNAMLGNRDEEYSLKVRGMVGSLNKVDQNLSHSETSVELRPTYSRALDAAHD
jgi:hypothetical protein